MRDEWHRLRGIRTLGVSDREVIDDLADVLVLIDRECEVREAELRRLAAACETVLPSFPTRRTLWKPLFSG